jgi:hypothetical protein
LRLNMNLSFAAFLISKHPAVTFSSAVGQEGAPGGR